MTLILPTIDTTPGAGDFAVDGGNKINAAFRQIERAMPLAQATRLLIEGDSIGGDMANYGGDSPLFWADGTHPVSFVFDKDKDNFAIGGTNTSEGTQELPGMTSTGRMAAIATRIKTCVAAGERVIVIDQSGTNDVGLSGYGDNSSPGTIANKRKMHKNMIDAGASHIYVMSIDPRKGTTADQSRYVLAVNAGLGEYCRKTPEYLTFVDTQWATGDDSAGLFLPQGLDGATGVHRDELHPTTRGAVYKARVLGPALRKGLPHRRSLIQPSASQQSSTGASSLRGNMLRKQGRFYDTGAVAAQTDGITVADAATVTGKANLPSAKLGSYPSFSSALTGTQTLEITQQPWPPAVTELGRTDIMCTRLRFAGTPSAFKNFTIGLVENSLGAYDIAAGPYESEVMMFAQNLKGLRGIGYAVSADASGKTYGSGFGIPGAGATAKVMQELNGLLNFRSPTPLIAGTKPANVTLTIGWGWNADVELSGDIYLFGAYIGQNIPLVAATL